MANERDIFSHYFLLNLHPGMGDINKGYFVPFVLEQSVEGAEWIEDGPNDAEIEMGNVTTCRDCGGGSTYIATTDAVVLDRQKRKDTNLMIGLIATGAVLLMIAVCANSGRR